MESDITETLGPIPDQCNTVENVTKTGDAASRQ